MSRYNLNLVIFLQFFILIVCNEQPQYQVSIWMKHPVVAVDGNTNVIGTHLCNGAIIHERLIITTANCLHYKVFGSTIINPIDAKMISIAAGSTTKSSVIYANVTKIDIAKGFNATTMENDLAILRLNESLPLESRTDIKWIFLDDHTDHTVNSCNVNFQNSVVPIPNTQETYEVKLLDNRNCTNTTNYKSSRTSDICSSYFLSTGSVCNITDNDILSSSDRGTALVCDSKLIGILSQIIPSDNKNTACNQNMKSMNALYTRIATYLNWIYEHISIESVVDLKKPNHTMSPPYTASAPSPAISQIPIIPSSVINQSDDKDVSTTTTAPAVSSTTTAQFGTSTSATTPPSAVSTSATITSTMTPSSSTPKSKTTNQIGKASMNNSSNSKERLNFIIFLIGVTSTILIGFFN